MSDLSNHIQALKYERRRMVNQAVNAGDMVVNIKAIATLQHAILAFEDVAREVAEGERLYTVIGTAAAPARPWPPVGSPAWFEQIDRDADAA